MPTRYSTSQSESPVEPRFAAAGLAADECETDTYAPTACDSCLTSVHAAARVWPGASAEALQAADGLIVHKKAGLGRHDRHAVKIDDLDGLLARFGAICAPTRWRPAQSLNAAPHHMTMT